MFEKVEHIGIAVKDLEVSNALYAKLAGISHYKIEEVEAEMVQTSFFQIGDTKIELLAATHEDSAIAKFIEARGEGLHHIAYAVKDIYTEIERLQSEGFITTRDEPIQGADNKLVIFVHPKTAGGVLVELCQEIE